MWLLIVSVTLLALTIFSTADIVSPLTYSLLEEESDVLLGVVSIDSGLTQMYGEDMVEKMSFTLVDDFAVHFDLFDLDNSGVLTTKTSVDRDVMCTHQLECTVDLSIRVQSEEVFHILQVVITVEDTNDNRPVFSDRVVSTSLSESSSPGSMFTIPAASDPDSPQYTINRYQLVSGEADFSLVANNDSPVWTQEVIYLSLLNHLDREQKDMFTIQVMVVDESGQSDTLTVNITITDVNDNNPKFLSDSYSVTVDENLSSGSRLVKVEATDPDEGDNGAIQYQFSSKTQTDYGSLFSLNTVTGEVFLVGELDREISDSYTLTISARNLSPGSIPDITHINIRVNDLNDNAPDIRLVTDDEFDQVHLVEAKAPGSFVAHIRVIDEDDALNGQFECILSHPVFELQKLYDTEFKIVTKATLDREAQNVYDLWVYCKDKGDTPQANSEYITVVIDDVNDNAPSFPKEMYETKVRENSGELTLIQVQATDPDEGDNGRASLQLGTQVSDILEIDDVTGIISAKKPLDREQYSQLVFNVIARDHGAPVMTSSVQVIIIIEDEDDNDPTFALKAYTLNVYEHLPPYSEVGQVVAVDDDSDLYNKFTYSLKPSYGQEDLFAISPSNGTIYTLIEFVRKDMELYKLAVIATSYGTNRPVTSGTMVTITITEVNDNSPEFIFPSLSNNTVIISGDHHVGQEIMTIQAEDGDTGESGKLTYFIVSGNTDNYINLFENNGTLTLNKELDDLGDHLFALVVRAQDNGTPVRSSDAVLNILVSKSTMTENKEEMTSNRNLTVVIIIGCVTGVIVVILLVIMAAVLRRRHHHKQTHHNKRSVFDIVVKHKSPDVCLGSALSSTQGSQRGSIEGMKSERKQSEMSVEEMKTVTKADTSVGRSNDYMDPRASLRSVKQVSYWNCISSLFYLSHSFDAHVCFV